MSHPTDLPECRGPEPGSAALRIEGLPPLPVTLERRVLKPSGYRLTVRVHLPGNAPKMG